MLQAMNTGHEGSMSTAHANSPRDLLSRLETMALMSDIDLPVAHVREQIAGALDLIVHMNRMPDGRRVVAKVSAVEGLRAGTVVLEDIFGWHRGPEPGFRPTGVLPSLLRTLHERDERIDPRVFTHHEVAAEREIDTPAPAADAHIRLAVPSTRWPGSFRRFGSVVE
jgi:pilus assembly protein CpaF